MAISAISYVLLYYEVHRFCFWVGDCPLSVWLLKHSIFSFFPRYKSVEDHRASCYLVLICMKLWSVSLCSFLWNYKDCICFFIICNSYLIPRMKTYVLHSFESLCKAIWANHLLGRCRCKLNLVSFAFFWCMVGCVLRALWLRCVAVELLKHKYMLNYNCCRSNL